MAKGTLHSTYYYPSPLTRVVLTYQKLDGPSVKSTPKYLVEEKRKLVGYERRLSMDALVTNFKELADGLKDAVVMVTESDEDTYEEPSPHDTSLYIMGWRKPTAKEMKAILANEANG